MYRQKQSERAKNHLSEETKVGLDEKKDDEFSKLSEAMRLKGADPAQKVVIESIRDAIKESGREIDQLADTVPFATEKTIATSLGVETPLLQVIELMI